MYCTGSEFFEKICINSYFLCVTFQLIQYICKKTAEAEVLLLKEHVLQVISVKTIHMNMFAILCIYECIINIIINLKYSRKLLLLPQNI